MSSVIVSALEAYAKKVTEQFNSGHAREHAYRPALEGLMSSFDNVRAVNDPKRSENGSPDFVFLNASNRDIILGYAEAKDVTVSVDKTLNTEQLRRYAGYEKLFLTNYLDFVFLQNGEEYERISIGQLKNGLLETDPSQYTRLINELKAFLEKSPEKIRSGKRLSIIMGGKARRIRDNVSQYLKHEDNERNVDLENIYGLMKELLVHDLTRDKFADMYAQTLVYGLFAARYNDETPADFNRREAVELVPKSNPFLRRFFDHIAGADFDVRLRHIVDELCEVFQVSDVQTLVHKHLRLFDVEDEKDPIIHFYEDFLKEYDPAERKKMGAYYTPVPIVQFIIRQVDELLKNEFGLSKGLADTSKVMHDVEVGQDMRHDRRKKLVTTQSKEFHRVQILDPAVGTATFLNETIKYIRKGFDGQEGQWPSYVNDHLLPRLHGFELMVAPYTVAHLKLGITLQETGVKDISQHLGVYLTNTLEEGVTSQQDLFASLGLAQAVAEESQMAGEIKYERPIMIVMGNPPYSVSSNNKSEFIQNLIKDYKKDLNERKINLDDDYIKFIRFAEDMIVKNGEGIVAMITNNSYLDGHTHRQMRKHLLGSFDKIFVLDLHGNSKKKETSPDGSKDENVFDIMQGVSIVLMAKKASSLSTRADVYHAELFGTRKEKFSALRGEVEFKKLNVPENSFFFVPKDLSLQNEYDELIGVDTLMPVSVSGVESVRDSIAIQFDKSDIKNVVNDFLELDEHSIAEKYHTSDARDWKISRAKDDVRNNIDNPQVWQEISYRPFDVRKTFYSGKQNGFVCNGRYNVMKHMTQPNLALTLTSKNRQLSTGYVMIAENICDRHMLDSAADSMSVFPLYLYHDDGTKAANFDQRTLRELVKNLPKEPEPETILDYVYASLHSPSYRDRYKAFLKIGFPHVPIPKDETEFNRLSKLGSELRQLHLMKASSINSFSTTFPEPGDSEVEKIVYENGKVYINLVQYFGNVSEEAWNFYIGGYQPAQKWLKDRKGRKLTNNDINHYQKVIKVLNETQKVMKLID